MNKQIKIYFTSDTHGFLYPTNYQNNQEMPMGVMKIINDYKKDENSLVIDVGDTIQGSPFTNYMWREVGECLVGQIFNAGKYDYYTLGNHDFNYGYDVLSKYINSMNAKCIIANIKDKTNKLNLAPYDIKTLENGLKVGIVGITSDYVTVWEKPEHLSKLEVLDAFTQAKNTLEEIKDKCDYTICIYHGGYEANLVTGEAYLRGNENIGYKICQNLDFDLLLTAHQHMPTNLVNVNNTHTMQLGAYGMSYGEIIVDFENDKVVKHTGTMIVPTAKPNEEMYNNLLEIEEKVQKYLDTKIGLLSENIPAVSKLEMGKNGSRLADLVNQISLEHTGADIACVGLGNVEIGLDEEISVRQVLIAFPYSNNIKVLKVTGEKLKIALERCAAYFDVENEEIKISNRFLIPKVEHYNYDFFAGISYVFDITKPLGKRVVSIKFKGEEIKPTDTFKVAMSDYRATGTGGYSCYKDCEELKHYGEDTQQLILDYIIKQEKVEIYIKSDYSIIK